jgi:transglutaminase-like putative cysteine protease
MKLEIEHVTHYTYAQEVKRSTQYLRLTPRASAFQRIVSWELSLPSHASITEDAFGNILHVLTLDTPHETLEIKARGVVVVDPDGGQGDAIPELLSPMVYLRPSRLTQADTAIRAFAAQYFEPHAPLQSLTHLMSALLAAMPYSPGSTVVSATAAESFAIAKGVCQDHTHVFLACCKSVGLPARYVSGYFHADNTVHVATHAWAEVWIIDQWHAFDITNNTTRIDRHIRLATGIDYLDACPVRGIRLGGGSENMQAIAAVQVFAPQ